MKSKCQVFTPPDYVEKLLDSVDYLNDLYGKRILENSCGDGNILVKVVQRYIRDCKNKGFSKTQIKKGLAKDIVGFEIDIEQYNKCIENLNGILDNEEIPRITWRIFNVDFLRNEDIEKYDYIVGNPPYITYNEINKDDQIFLKESFLSCQKGKFDYCYAFIEKSISLLSDNGKMSYLIPSSIFKTVCGSELRNIINPYLYAIKDYAQEKVFDSACVKSAILVLHKNNNDQLFLYNNGLGKTIKIEKQVLGDKWFFHKMEKKEKRFGNYFKVSNVVATLLNEAFVLKEYKQDKNGNYITGNTMIECGIVRDTATPRTFRTGKKEKIIFPYNYSEENKLLRFDEKEIKKKYPGAYKYLSTNKKRLVKRDSDENVKWFEYGRCQALTSINCEKCLLPRVISSEIKIYRLSKECIPYAGLFIVPKEDNKEYSLEDAITILEAKEFKEYVECVGTHINGNSLRITSKDVENYTF